MSRETSDGHLEISVIFVSIVFCPNHPEARAHKSASVPVPVTSMAVSTVLCNTLCYIQLYRTIGTTLEDLNMGEQAQFWHSGDNFLKKKSDAVSFPQFKKAFLFYFRNMNL